MQGSDVVRRPIHLGLGATAEIEPEFDGDLGWYAAYTERHASDGHEGRLVSMHTFSEPWRAWEMHPNGAEVVICVIGTITLHQERSDGSVQSIALTGGQYAVNPPGTWHTADPHGEATAVFITPGMGTEHKPRA